AEHAGGRKAEKALGLDTPVAEARAGRRIRHPVSNGDVPGSRDNLHYRSTGRNGGDLVLRGSGKRPEALDFGDHDAIEVDILLGDPRDLVAGQGQSLGESLDIDGDVYEFLEPVEGNQHGFRTAAENARRSPGTGEGR